MIDPADLLIQQGIQEALDAAVLATALTLKKDASVSNAGNAPPTTVAAAIVKPADNTAVVTSGLATPLDAYPVDLHLLSYDSTDPVWRGIQDDVLKEFGKKDEGEKALKNYIEN